MTNNTSKQTNSYEKIDALEQGIQNTEQDLKQSERVLSTVKDPEQRGAIETKNERRKAAIKEGKSRIEAERQDMKNGKTRM